MTFKVERFDHSNRYCQKVKESVLTGPELFRGYNPSKKIFNQEVELIHEPIEVSNFHRRRQRCRTSDHSLSSCHRCPDHHQHSFHRSLLTAHFILDFTRNTQQQQQQQMNTDLLSAFLQTKTLCPFLQSFNGRIPNDI